jgi:dipeptidyl aminopeptidase/acylaminoacyl peptidase
MEENQMKKLLGLLLVQLMFSTFLSFAQSQGSTPVEVTIDRNGVLLKGKFHVAEGTGFLPTVLLLQGFPGNETDVIGLGKILAESGINTLTFNYSGTFKSQGNTSLENSLLDTKAAFDFLKNGENIKKFKIDTASIILGGWSYGGGMAMTYAIKHPEIRTVFTIAGVDWGEYYEEYLRNPEFKKTTDGSMAKMAAMTEQIRFEKGAMPDEITKDGIIRLDSSYFLRKSARQLVPKDILIICGWDDPMATVDKYILPFYRALKKEKAQKVQITAFQDGHSFGRSKAELAQTILKWITTIPERKK